MKNGIIIFSRTDSSRLPSKALIDIGGKTLLQRVIDRAKQVQNVEEIILATSDREIDRPLVEMAHHESIKSYQGSIDNVALRALNCAKYYNLQYFARICGDRPFFSPVPITNVFKEITNQEHDLYSNIYNAECIPGLTTEIISTDALNRVIMDARDKHDLEHMTSYIYKNPNKFNVSKINFFNNNENNVSLVVDNIDDLKKAKFIINNLDSNPENEGIEKIISLAKLWNKINER